MDSNDKLYGSDKKFISEVNKMCSKILEEVLCHLKHLGVTEQYEKQSILALELFICMVTRADLTESSLSLMATNLWNLSQKQNYGDSKFKVGNFLIKKYFLFFKYIIKLIKTLLFTVKNIGIHGTKKPTNTI